MPEARREMPIAGWGAALRGDRLLHVGLGVWALSLAPSFLPVLPPDLTWVWADQFSDVPTLGMATLGAVLARRRARDARARAFWGFLVLGILAWFAVRGLYLLVPYEVRGTGFDVATDVSYLLGYLATALALERRPDADVVRGTEAWGRGLESTALLVFCFTLLSYLTLAPSVFHPGMYASWVSSLLLYAAFDTYLAARTLVLLRSTARAEWKRTFALLAATFTVWLVCDVVEGLMYLRVIPEVDAGRPSDLLWALPSLALLVAVRSPAWRVGHDEGAARPRRAVTAT